MTRSLPAYAALAALTLALVGCGDDAAPADDRPAPTAAGASSVTPSDAGTPAAPPTRTVEVDLADLPTGPPPRVDVVVGPTLFHDGEAITPAQPVTRPLGSYDGRTYVSLGTADGDQVATVADDGSLTEVGEPHLTYNHFPQLVAQTGHVLLVAQDRSGPSTLWVLDARSGEELAVVRGDDYGELEPADRTLAELWAGPGSVDRPVDVAARSADGVHEVVVNDPYASRVRLTLRPTGGPGGTTFVFPASELNEASVLVEQVAVESPRSFLAVVVAGGRYSVVRCTTDGTCERTTPEGPEAQVAGTGSDTVLAEPAD